MTSGLGLKIGSAASVAVSTTSSGTYDAVVRETALDLTPGREPALATTGSAHGSEQLAGFTARVGDPVALIADDGRRFSGEELYATALQCLADETTADVDDAGTRSRSVVVACPNSWQPYTVDALRAAAAERGLDDVTFVPEAIASVAAATATDSRLAEHATTPAPTGAHSAASGDGVVVVYDLGASALNVSVVRIGDDSKILGRPLDSEEISGSSFDQLILTHVLESVGATEGIDPFDPDTVTALRDLRSRCRTAKEALSSDTETTVSVRLPGLATETRLVRSEIEDLLREEIAESTSLVRDAVAATGHNTGAVSALILTGGGAAIPLVTETMSSVLRIPIVVDDDPVTTSAFGAAILASEIGSAAAALDEMPANAAAASAELVAARNGELLPAQTRSVAPAPRSTVVEKVPMARSKRFAIIGGVVVAIALLTAGGLSVGTALSNDPAPSTTPNRPSASVAPTTTGAPSASAAATAPSAAPGAQGSTGADGSRGSSGSGTGGGGTGSGASGGGTGTGGRDGGSTSGGTGTGDTGSGGTGSGGSGSGDSGSGAGSGDTGSGTGSGGTGSGDSGSGSGGTDSDGSAPPETAGRPTLPPIPTFPRFPGALNEAPDAIQSGLTDTFGGLLDGN